MATTPNSLVTAQTPYAAQANFSAVTACTTRAPTATAALAGANIIALAPASTDGLRVDFIKVKGSSNSFTAPTAAQTVTIWKHDGSIAYPIMEISVQLVTPSTTTGSFEITVPWVGSPLPLAYSLYASTSVTTVASTTAFIVHVEGGLL